MKLIGSYEIELDKNSIWEALNDPELLKKSIPGCEKFVKKSDTVFTATATNKIGPFNATFEGDIELKELNPPDSYKIVGNGNSPVGFASGEAFVKLEEGNGITKLVYSVKANVGGKIAQVGSRLIDMTAKKLADIFFAKFTELLLAKKGDSNVKIKKEKTLFKKSLNSFKINKKKISAIIVVALLIAIYLVK